MTGRPRTQLSHFLTGSGDSLNARHLDKSKTKFNPKPTQTRNTLSHTKLSLTAGYCEVGLNYKRKSSNCACVCGVYAWRGGGDFDD